MVNVRTSQKPQLSASTVKTANPSSFSSALTFLSCVLKAGTNGEHAGKQTLFFRVPATDCNVENGKVNVDLRDTSLITQRIIHM